MFNKDLIAGSVLIKENDSAKNLKVPENKNKTRNDKANLLKT